LISFASIEPDEDGRHRSEVLAGFWLRPEWSRQAPLPEATDLLLAIAPDAYKA
jgi:hypothetical protein